MTIKQYLDYATKELENSNIATARLDALVLMEFFLNIDRSKLLAYQNDQLLTERQKNVLNRVLKKRSMHIPISYITHNTEFYGRNFYIDNNVLEPRPESETIIDLYKRVVLSDDVISKKIRSQEKIRVADIGTGSGALGITIALEDINSLVDLVDIDKKAIRIAKRNVVFHTINVRCFLADLIPNTPYVHDVFVCNLPYIPDSFNINLAASHEPHIAIFGGYDGLELYRKLFKTMDLLQHNPLYIITESLPLSHPQLKLIAETNGYKLALAEDFVQVFKKY